MYDVKDGVVWVHVDRFEMFLWVGIACGALFVLGSELGEVNLSGERGDLFALWLCFGATLKRKT